MCMDRRGFWHPVPELSLFALERFFLPFSFSGHSPSFGLSLPLSLFGDHTRVKLDDARLWMGLTVVDLTPRDGDNLA